MDGGEHQEGLENKHYKMENKYAMVENKYTHMEGNMENIEDISIQGMSTRGRHGKHLGGAMLRVSCIIGEDLRDQWAEPMCGSVCNKRVEPNRVGIG